MYGGIYVFFGFSMESDSRDQENIRL